MDDPTEIIARDRVREAIAWAKKEYGQSALEINVRLAELVLLQQSREKGRAAKAERVQFADVQADEPVIVVRAETREGPLATALRVWRAETAKDSGRPPHHVMHNRTLFAIAEVRPGTPEELAKIVGMGPWKIKTYGPDLLRIITEHAAPSPALSPKGRTVTIGPMGTALLAALADGPVPAEHLIQEAADATGKTEGDVAGAVRKLAAAGRIQQDKRGRYSLVKSDS